MDLYPLAIDADLRVVDRAIAAVQAAASAEAQCRRTRRSLEAARRSAIKRDNVRVVLLRQERELARLEAAAATVLDSGRTRSALTVLDVDVDVDRELDGAIVNDSLDSTGAAEVLALLERARAELNSRRNFHGQAAA